ncbi:MAG: hypothetical protein OCD01_18860 [Fibrobacterales bacterium]
MQYIGIILGTLLLIGCLTQDVSKTRDYQVLIHNTSGLSLDSIIVTKSVNDVNDTLTYNHMDFNVEDTLIQLVFPIDADPSLRVNVSYIGYSSDIPIIKKQWSSEGKEITGGVLPSVVSLLIEYNQRRAEIGSLDSLNLKRVLDSLFVAYILNTSDTTYSDSTPYSIYSSYLESNAIDTTELISTLLDTLTMRNPVLPELALYEIVGISAEVISYYRGSSALSISSSNADGGSHSSNNSGIPAEHLSSSVVALVQSSENGAIISSQTTVSKSSSSHSITTTPQSSSQVSPDVTVSSSISSAVSIVLSSSLVSSSSEEVSSSVLSSSAMSSSVTQSSSQVSSSSAVSSSSSLSSSSESSTQSSGDDDRVTVPARTSGSWDQLNMGDMYLLNNKWGSDDAQCSSTYELFINEDYTFGWEFDRPDCGYNKAEGDLPDYPQLDIGIMPHNKEPTDELSISTSAILPVQVKDINTASVTLDNFRIDLTQDNSWNINFEMWLTREDPRDTLVPNPKIELMVLWGWNENRWGCNQVGGKFDSNLNLDAGSLSYTLCHQGDDWGGQDSTWDYYQFRAESGEYEKSKPFFSGTLDINDALDWLVTHAGISEDLWVTRFVIGSEIDNNTAGTVTFDDVVFEINGVEKSPSFAN